MPRTCQINPNGGPVEISLSVNNALISGGDFKIYDFNSGAVNENFKMHTDTSGTNTHQSMVMPSNLIGQVLSWQILTCSPIITNSGILNVEVFQDGNPCSMNPLAMYNLNSVPNCSINQALPVQGGLHFI
jgi:hypothetical protein